jgi:predicted transcriptional regulator
MPILTAPVRLVVSRLEGSALTLGDAIGILKAECIVGGGNLDTRLSGCFAADLMSDVLAFARPASVLLTGLATDQTIRTAAIKHIAAVIVVGGKSVSSEMVEAAREASLGLYRTPLAKYESCGLLMQGGLRPYRREG